MTTTKVSPSYLLTVDDIVDWLGLQAQLRQNNGKTCGTGPTILSLLPQQMRERLATPTRDLDKDFKSDFVAHLNELLRRRDLFATFPTQNLDTLNLNDEVKGLLSRDRNQLSVEDCHRLNRIILESCYPHQIRESDREPYVGPRSFERAQRGFFFGRDDEADELVSLLTAHPMVLVYSQSGAGKTSLLKAKLIPKLEEEERFNVLPPMRVQGQIPASFKVPRHSNIFVLNALASCGLSLEQLKRPDLNLITFLQGREQQLNQYGEPCPTVLVFDQFEELFTSYPARWQDRQPFFEQLAAVIDGNSKTNIKGDPLLRVIFCMREDYIAELDPYLPLLPERLRTRFRLEHLREAKALVAITKPLEPTNRRFAKNIAEQLVKNLLKMPSQSITGTQTLGLYVEPVQLQVVCQSLWHALTPQETIITRKHLDKYGDVSEALSNFYETSIRAVAGTTGVKEEELRKWFGDRLITSEGTRAPVYRGNENTGGMPNVAIDKLEAARLIKGEWKGTNVRWYELAHDRFVEPIRRSNEKWLANQSRGEQIRLRLEAKASKWQPGSDLLDVDELIEARRLVRAGIASKSLQTLLDASRAGEQRKRIRFYKLVGTASMAVVVLLLIAVIYSAYQRAAARKAENIAKSRLLATKASLSLDVDPEFSVLLAQEARTQFYDTDEAKDVIRKGLLSLSNVAGALRGHTGKVKSAEFSFDGHYVLTTSDDGLAKLWDVGSQKALKDFGGGQDRVSYAAFSPDGKYIVTASANGAQIWDTTTGDKLHTLQGHKDIVNTAAFSPDSKLVATAGYDKTVMVWNALDGSQVKVLSGHTGTIREIRFSPDGNHLATEAEDETARIWDIHSGSAHVLHGLSGPKSALAFSPDGKLLVTEGGPDTQDGVNKLGVYPATVWEVDTGKEKATLGGHELHITGVAFSADGKYIVTSSGDNSARVWSPDGKQICELRGHTKPVSHAEFSPDGRFVVTAAADNTARLWDSLNGESITELRGHSLPVNTATFSPDGKVIITASDDRTVRLWTLDKKNEVVLRGHSGPVNSVAFSPDGKYIVTAGADSRLWMKTNETVASIGVMKAAGSAGFIEARFSPDGKFIATGGQQTSQLWNADSIQGLTTKIEREICPNVAVKSIAFSPDEKEIIMVRDDGKICSWNMSTNIVTDPLPEQTGLYSAAFSPDGKLIITAGSKGTKIWNAANHQLARKLGPDTETRWAQYSPDGALIVSVSGNSGVIWNAADGKEIATLRGHTDRINRAWFSPNSSLLVTASDDKTARVWNSRTGQRIAILRGHSGSVRDAVFSPDGEFVLTASEDLTARLYPHGAFVPFEELEKLIQKRVVRELTDDERRDLVEQAMNLETGSDTSRLARAIFAGGDRVTRAIRRLIACIL